jgi:hypothetical protein
VTNEFTSQIIALWKFDATQKSCERKKYFSRCDVKKNREFACVSFARIIFEEEIFSLMEFVRCKIRIVLFEGETQ